MPARADAVRYGVADGGRYDKYRFAARRRLRRRRQAEKRPRLVTVLDTMTAINETPRHIYFILIIVAASRLL